jgi:putative membrane protein
MKTVDWEKPQRQSPVVLIVLILEGIKQIWPLILLGFFRSFFKNHDGPQRLDRQVWFILIGTFLMLVFIKTKQIIHYFSFRFRLQQNLLLVEKGFFTKVKTEIPFSKIQAIHQNQSFIHRVTNTCELIIGTSGTADEEITIKGISLEKAMGLKGLLSSKAEIITDEKVEQAEQSNAINLGVKDLLKLCLSENHLKTLLIILAFILARFQDLQEYLGFDSVG